MVFKTFDKNKKNLKNIALIILGASGDLAKKKLIPALAKLFAKGDLDYKSCVVIGSGRTPFTHEEFRDRFVVDNNEFLDVLYYHRNLSGLKEFVNKLGNFEKIVFFFSLPPQVYISTAEQIYNEGFKENNVNLIIEKPFGHNYSSAKELDKGLTKFFKEEQIFRIDHYLAKEAVQNILVFRFANTIFKPIWNCKYIKSIQINAEEDIGIGKRAAYFDKAGIIRDMVQNHLMQLLALLTMEPPVSLDPKDIRVQKLNVLRTINIEEFHRFQYEGYREEEGVDPNSTTETYAELKLKINNFRWYETPVYIRAGKGMPRKGTEIAFEFDDAPKILFNENGNLKNNRIVFTIQPAEGIIVDIASKTPGESIKISNTNLKFCYKDSFSGEIPEAYQKLLLDAIKGDKTLFVSSEETEVQWKIFDEILDKGPIHFYKFGTEPKSRLDVEWIDFLKYGNIC